MISFNTARIILLRVPVVAAGWCQLDLSLLLTSLGGSRRDRTQGGFNTKRLEQPQNFGADGLINAQAAKGDAAIAAMVQQSALAVIATSFARRAAVGDVQLAAAVSTPQQTSQQRLASAY
jgi:hypothetical protein